MLKETLLTISQVTGLISMVGGCVGLVGMVIGVLSGDINPKWLNMLLIIPLIAVISVIAYLLV